MAEEDTTQRTDRSVWVLIEMYALGAVLHGFDVMRPDGLWAASGWWITGGILALIGWHWAKVKTWISPRVARTATLAATDFRWWMGSAMLILLVVTFSRFVEERRWPYFGWSYSSVATEARESTLIEWLTEAQTERDQATAERKSAQNGWAADRLTMEAMQSQSGETHRQLVAAEGQKATLTEWVQAAQHERDDARQERDRLQKQIQAQQSRHLMQYYPLPSTPSVAEECVKLAQRLADLHPAIVRSDQAEMGQIRSTMKDLGCGGGASTK